LPAGALRKLDFERLPGHGNLDAELIAKFAQYDPGNAHTVGYSWGTVGVGYDESRLGELAPDTPADNWRLGHDASQPTQVQLQSAERLLLAVRPRMRAAKAGREVDLRYLITTEGSVAWFDSLAIPADTPHPETAHAFMEFMLRPDIAARNASYIGSASMNSAAGTVTGTEPRTRPDTGALQDRPVAPAQPAAAGGAAFRGSLM
jgi:putrescine transport system substrate-binding protein